MQIRPGQDSDADGIIALIGRCWADYPGCVLDLEHEERRLLALASYFAERGGALWVADDRGVAGMIATIPSGGGDWEICKMYVHPDRHGSGLADVLLDTAEAHAVAAGAVGLRLWTDTRFRRAHRFYERRGYSQDGPARALDDLSNSFEYVYARPVRAQEAR